jgi:hypothetical protein
MSWLDVVEDVIPTLEPTIPAPWQQRRLARMQLRDTTVIGAGSYDGKLVARAAHAPIFTLAHGGDGPTGNSAQIRAFLVGGNGSPVFLMAGGNARRWRNGEPGVTLRAAHEPAMTLRAGRADVHRIGEIAEDGRWVQCNLRCLARWQTVPDSYIGLTPEINGNGVPPLFAQRQMELLRDVTS